MGKENGENRIALGTAQFGLDYGINNLKGQVVEADVFKILDYAFSRGIDTLDTAYNYGDSEKVLGNYLKQSNNKFKIISKLPGNSVDIQTAINKTLCDLSSESIYGYLFHNFSSFMENSALLEKLKDLKQKKILTKIGFSLYYPAELEFLIDNEIEVDLIQIPFSIFDQRFTYLLEKAKSRGIEIHARSVFLQGLVFKNPESLDRRFLPIKDKLIKLNDLANNLKVSVSGLCLNFAILNEAIDKVVIGVDNLGNLKENIDDCSKENLVKTANVLANLFDLKEDDEEIILPINWS